MNVGNTDLPKLQSVQPSGGLIKELTTGGKPCVTGELRSWELLA